MQDIKLEHIEKAFDGVTVLHDFSQSFTAGGIYAVMGPSGCGKTTLLRILGGLERPDAGSMKGTEGVPFSFMFQEDRLLEYLDAGANIRFTSPACSKEEALLALTQLGIPAAELHKPVREYSGGMKRRTALARTLLYPGEVLLLDEPFKGLDEKSVETAAAFLLSRRRGRTVIMTTHSKNEAALCTASLVILPSKQTV